MDKIILLSIVIGLHGFWIYKLATYDWDNFEEDSKTDTGWPSYD